MDAELAPLSWTHLVETWRVHLLPTVIGVLLLATYLGLRLAARRGSWLRTASFVTGIAVWWLATCSGLAVYGEAVFWVHMVLHLVLIMVVPALLVLGSPLQTLSAALDGDDGDEGDGGGGRVRAVLATWPVSALTHPATGLAAYTAVIVGTHLTGFMDQMMSRPWTSGLEELLYVGSGWLLLAPLLGQEPLRWRLPGLGRIAVLLVAMVPDTVVGITLMQTQRNPFPAMLSGAGWRPDPVLDVQTGGAIMWVGGDGLMMVLAVGVALAVLTRREQRSRPLGDWLEGVRRDTLAGLATDDAIRGSDVDEDERALEAYNRMLRRRAGHER
jgi:cytochrome c oxidase assembly factor CtaG